MKTRLMLATAVLVALSGCATHNAAREVQENVRDAATERADAARTPTRSNESFVVDEGFYAARRPITVTPINPDLQLPELFRQSAPMDVQTPIALTEIANRITRLTGIPVMIEQDVLSQSSRGSNASQPTQETQPTLSLPSDPSAPPTSLPPLPTALPSIAALNNTSSDLVLSDVVYQGNLAGLIDDVTARLNLSWRWTGQRVEIFRYDTKMFRLNALADTVSSSTNLTTSSSTSSGGGGGSSGGGGGSSGGGNTGSSGSNFSVSASTAIWEDVEQSIESLLSEEGTMSIASSAGLVTVRDTPAVLRMVESQIAEFNRIYGRQVTLNIEVYAVELNQDQAYSLNWNALWQSLSSEWGFNYTSTGGSQGNAFTIEVLDPNSPFTGSTLVPRALGTLGQTATVQTASLTTTNGMTVPFNISREEAYVQSSSTTQNSGSDLASQSLTPGVATEGFAVNFTPRILDNNDVLIRYSLDLSTIEEIVTFESPGGGTAIQLPRRAVRNFLQNINLKSGQTMVLTGFQQIQGNRSGSGPFGRGSAILGGANNASTGNLTLVIVVTPFVQ